MQTPLTTAPRRVSILGATGSIGDSTTDIIMANRDKFGVDTLVGNSNVEKLAQRAKQLGAARAIVADEACYDHLKQALAGTNIEAAAGREAVIACAREAVDLVICAMVGAAGIEPTMAAILAGNTVALANKEALVCAGPVMMKLAAQKGVRILPLDSEHNALFQVFEEANRNQIEAITVTASGGPFRTWSKAQLLSAKLADALNHPNWSMGQKVTIDSASLANKGLEVIEAHHLFSMPPQSIKVAVHPQSIVHGMVHYDDGSVLAQLGTPDMRTPIAAALAWPQRYQAPQVKRLDLTEISNLTFEKPDMDRFPMLRLAFEAMGEGGPVPAIFNAANEVAVRAFVDGYCAFHEIATIVAMTMEKGQAELSSGGFDTLDDVLKADQHGQHLANAILQERLHQNVGAL
ncbi:MAG: 1-deoxy-D-xylulose-5-phosphate reductoisomerase [Devosiaceae bacterium]